MGYRNLHKVRYKGLLIISDWIRLWEFFLLKKCLKRHLERSERLNKLNEIEFNLKKAKKTSKQAMWISLVAFALSLARLMFAIIRAAIL